MDILSSILGLTSGPLNAIYTNTLNEINANRQNKYWHEQATTSFNLNEKSANNAMNRQIQLYNMLQSPEAIKQQLIKAGLNPALMYSDGSMGGQVTQGPQGGASQAQGVQTFGLQNIIDPLTMAQIRNINADTNKKEEEKDNISQDTKVKQAQEENIKANTLWTDVRRQLDENNLTISNETINDQITAIQTKTLSALEELEQKKLANSITKDTYTEQVGKIKQEFANTITQGIIMQEEIKKLQATTANINTDTKLKQAEEQRTRREAKLLQYKWAETINNINLLAIKAMSETEQQKYLQTMAENVEKEFAAIYGWDTFTKEDIKDIGQSIIDAISTAFGIGSGSALVGKMAKPMGKVGFN